MSEYKICGEVDNITEKELVGYPKLLQKLLFNRGLTNKDDAEKFLNPSYERDINNPFLILNMEKAADRVIDAIGNEERIVIYGDYDCDGIPGSVVLHDFFKKINYKNFYNYIPHRNKEGYGLNEQAIASFSNDGVDLMITVDCGITDIKEVEYANTFGIDVIITDHHLPAKSADLQELLPDAYAILNSKQSEDTYPDDMLCGAGVAWKLVQALISKKGKDWGIGEGWEKWLLDMAGLSTIADMVPLKKENRAIAYFGMKVLRKSRRPGFQKLLAKIGANQSHLTEDDISFMIAPRINAASRMDIPFEAFRLLSTDDEVLAGTLASHLHNINEERKGVVLSMFKEAKHTIESRELKEIIVVGNPNWRPGVLGLLASKLAEDYDKPAFVWGRDESGDRLKGSCRSDGRANVVALMMSTTEGTFLDVGGHEFSGGFSIAQEKIHFLEEELIIAQGKSEKNKDHSDSMMIDGELSIDDVNWQNYNLIEKLAPFGIENHKPTFIFKNMEVEGSKLFGKTNNHLELSFKKESGEKISAIGFFMTHESHADKNLEAGNRIDLIATFEKSMFRGRKELRLRIVDIH